MLTLRAGLLAAALLPAPLSLTLASQQTTDRPQTPAQQTSPLQTPAAPVPGPVRDSGKSGATTNVNSLDVKTDHAVANPADLPPTIPAGRPVIGLALEGGGALGLAHIGVIKWFEEHHIPVDRIAGTSMGALVGSLYASGHSAAEMATIAESRDFLRVFTVEVPYTDVSFRRRQDRRELPQAISVGLKGGPSLRNALIADTGLNAFLYTNLFRYDRSQLTYDTLPIPFRCVATDLNTMQPVIFDGGPLPQAIRASISIPGVFSPVEYHGHFLVDGAIMDNLPIDIARQDLHADVVIGIHLDASAFTPSDVSSVVGVFARAFAAGTARNERVSEQSADLLIHVQSDKFSTGDYGQARNLIDLGYQSAAKNAAALEKYALSDADWEAYLADRHSRTRPQPGRLELVKVDGDTAGAQHRVLIDLQPLHDQPITAPAVDDALRRVQGNGTVQASYDTFSTAGSPSALAPLPQSPTDRALSLAPDNGIAVRLSPVQSGPPFLLIGLDLTAENSNVTRSTFDFRLINTDLGGFGSELRSNIRLGFLTQLNTEYYRLLGTQGYFIQPQIGILRQPVYLWQNQDRISEHLEQQAGGGLDIGRTYNRNLQISARYRAQVVRWHPVSGDDGTPVVSGTAQNSVVRVVYDSTRTGVLSNSGMRLDLSAGALFNTVDSRNAPVVQFSASKAFPLSSQSFLIGSAEVNSYFRRDVTEALRFTVGGPLRLSAASVDEFRGTDDYLARLGYARRIATLPSGYGQGLYAGFGYEAAEVWSPERRAILRQDGVLTVIGVTPLGAITLGGSVGDDGHRKFFFTYGRIF